MRKLRVLVACEFSQVVMSEFYRLGHDVYSCDLQACIGSYPDRHIIADVFTVLNSSWDLVIAHPPCTYLTHAGEGYFTFCSASGAKRWKNRLAAADFFMRLYNAPVPHICVENPVGFMNQKNVFRPPDQILQPFLFGDPVQKRTCLWLRGLPRLSVPFGVSVKPDRYASSSGRLRNTWERDTLHLDSAARRNARSVFFPGVARAMANQWSDYLNHVLFGVPRTFLGCQMEFSF